MDNDLIKITGEIKNYIYETDESMYKVAKIITEKDELTITGAFPHLDEGLTYDFLGFYKDNPKYGRQFFVQSYSRSETYSIDGLISYLSSERFYGIGEKLATNIVDTLGNDCIQKILDNKDALDDVKGINESKKDLVYNTIKDNYLTDDVFIRLYGFGLTPKMAGKIYEKYGLDAANIIEDNPYILIDEVDGFGFKKSDLIAYNLGFKANDIKRLKAALLYTINFVCYQNGFTFLTHEQLINSSINLLNNNPNITKDDLDNALNNLIEKGKLINEDERIYDSILYKAECDLALKIDKIKKSSKKVFNEDDVEDALNYVESNLGINYTPLQRDAIISSLSNKLSIITGGPGTGKSTILKGILLCYAKLLDISPTDEIFSYKVCMVAPTGRAAKRMSDTTNHKATTIHKALGYNYTDSFSRDENNPLNASLLIVDEASMLDISLASSLFRALPNKCQVILIGDSNQLPSVGPGLVLHDLISSFAFSYTPLKEIYRQSINSYIPILANEIKNKELSEDFMSKKDDYNFLSIDSSKIKSSIKKICEMSISKGLDERDIQILAPMYKGENGIDNLNKILQELFNPKDKSKKEIKIGDRVFREHDKVLKLSNDIDKGVFNGDIGYIKEIVSITHPRKNDIFLIDFDGEIHEYKKEEMSDITHAYAMSIHKSQGSEFPHVVMVVSKSYYKMLYNKLLYTGISRAKKSLVIVGEEAAFKMGVLNDYSDNRNTNLLDKIVNKI